MGQHASTVSEEVPALIEITGEMTPKELEDAEAHNLAVTRLIKRLEFIKRKRVLTSEDIILSEWGARQ